VKYSKKNTNLNRQKQSHNKYDYFKILLKSQVFGDINQSINV